jgi:hypothetical protein
MSVSAGCSETDYYRTQCRKWINVIFFVGMYWRIAPIQLVATKMETGSDATLIKREAVHLPVL